MKWFGKKKPSGEIAGMAPAEFLSAFVEHHVDTEHMKAAARSSARPVAVLKAQIPIGSGRAAGWFGGKPKLPEGVEWPIADGQRLPFLCQVDLSALPPGLWGGIGPRKGWLAFFLGAKATPLQVLHVQGTLAERDGPGQQSAVWTWSTEWKSPEILCLPSWPFTVDERPGTVFHEDAGPATAARDVMITSSMAPALGDRAYLPFDQNSLLLLTDSISAHLVKQARGACLWSTFPNLRDEDRERFEQQKPIAMKSLQRYFELESPLRSTGTFCIEQVAEVMKEVADLPTYELSYERVDEHGYREIRFRETKLSEPPRFASYAPPWWSEFQQKLNWHAVVAYTRDPAALHAALRARLEVEWRDHFERRSAAMGHAPTGHIYTPHGPATPNEVLLELPTNQLIGWIWGDCYSLVLTIEREALRRGDFSRVSMDITN
jgi:hypothetical protein